MILLMEKIERELLWVSFTQILLPRIVSLRFMYSITQAVLFGNVRVAEYSLH